MPPTLLLDLDDTLLNNDINHFLPGYLRALAKYLAGQVSPEKMGPQLLASTQKMLQNQDPALTLEDVFDADFYPALGVTKDELGESIEVDSKEGEYTVFTVKLPIAPPKQEFECAV